MLNVLVLCTGNSARSILAESLFRSLSKGRVNAFSAGSRPAGLVHPAALSKLEREGIDVEGLRSKSWDEFSGSDAIPMDVVITVCDNAKGETCPVWYGSPVQVHWGIPDPAAAADDVVTRAFDEAFDALSARVSAALLLPLEDLGSRELTDALRRIHETS